MKKLERKEREVTFETAVNTLNDIAGVRVVCYFADDIYQIADAVRRQKDFTIVKEKNYIRKPKKRLSKPSSDRGSAGNLSG